MQPPEEQHKHQQRAKIATTKAANISVLNFNNSERQKIQRRQFVIYIIFLLYKIANHFIFYHVVDSKDDLFEHLVLSS